MDRMELKALGKINLGLDVLGKREDGYHEVRMVMQTLYLYDNVELCRQKEPGIEISSNLNYLPRDESNIAWKAAQLLMDEFQIQEGIRISLDKHIPVAAGMAGGSADAAAVLFGMNRMFSLGLSQEELIGRGARLGADVPYCIMRGTVLAEGIGEKLTPLAPLPRCLFLIAKPPISVSTKNVYRRLDEIRVERHPDIDRILAGIEAQDLEQVTASMGNILESVTIEMYPVIEEIKRQMMEAGALGAMMSGSGPTVFGVFRNRRTAKEALRKVKAQGLAYQVYLAGVHNVKRR